MTRSRATLVSLPQISNLVSGTAQVTEGSGRLLVLAVGERSEWGRTMALVASEPAPTPLQAALGTLAAAIGKVGLVVGALCFVVLLVRRAPAARREPLTSNRAGLASGPRRMRGHSRACSTPVDKAALAGSGPLRHCTAGRRGSLWRSARAAQRVQGARGWPVQSCGAAVPCCAGQNRGPLGAGCRWCIRERGFPLDRIVEGPLQFFIFAVTIVVVAVPEGLPLAVTISLAYRRAPGRAHPAWAADGPPQTGALRCRVLVYSYRKIMVYVDALVALSVSRWAVAARLASQQSPSPPWVAAVQGRGLLPPALKDPVALWA